MDALTRGAATSHRCRCCRYFLLSAVASQLLRDQHSLSALQILLITIPSQVSTVSLFTREAERRGGQGRLGLHSCARRHCRSSGYLLGFLGPRREGKQEREAPEVQLLDTASRNDEEEWTGTLRSLPSPSRQFRIHQVRGTLFSLRPDPLSAMTKRNHRERFITFPSPSVWDPRSLWNRLSRRWFLRVVIQKIHSSAFPQ